jgi:hypothetical protein
MTRMLADGGEDSGTWASWLTPQVILALGAVLLVVILLVALLAWRVYKRARRSGALERGLLALRAQALPAGPARELAELRQRLHASLTGTGQVIDRAATAGLPTAELTGLLAQLKTAGAGLEVDLRMLEREPDPDEQAAGLRLYRAQVDQLIDAAGQARQAVTRTAAEDRDSQLRELSSQVGERVSALAAYRQAYRELGGGRA